MIVVMNEELDGCFVHLVAFGKGECLPDQAPNSLPHGIVVAFDVIGAPALVAAVMLRNWNDLAIGFPQVAVAQAGFIGCGNSIPQHAARCLTPAAESISHDLAGAPTQRQPQPPFVLAPEHP